MDIDIPALMNTAIPYLQNFGVGLAANVAWHLIIQRFTSPGQRETVARVEEHPDDARGWEMLRLHLTEALEQDPAFREELAKLLPTPPPVTQTATNNGTNNTIIQINGQGNAVTR